MGRKWHIACDDFCAAVKCSAKPSTMGPERLMGETGESKKAVLSAFLIFIRFSCSNTTKLAMALLIAWAVQLSKHGKVGTGLIHGMEEFRLKDL